MKTLQEENFEELKVKVLDLIAKTSVELGHRADAKTMSALSKIFAEDLQKANNDIREFIINSSATGKSAKY